jgi:hypothetical protein
MTIFNDFHKCNYSYTLKVRKTLFEFNLTSNNCIYNSTMSKDIRPTLAYENQHFKKS